MGTDSKIDIAASHQQAIGCSRIAQVLGLSRFGTPYELWAQYTGRAPWPDLSNELRVALGEPMEAVLQPFVEARLGGKLRRDRREYKHPTLPMVGHVDFRLARDAAGVVARLGGPARERPVLDMKTSLGFGARHRFGEDGTDELDADVLLQMHGYLLLTGADLAFAAALVPGPELKIFAVEADAEMQDLIEAGIAAFWARVRADMPPEPISEADARRVFPLHATGKLLEADPALLDGLQRLAEIKAQIRGLEKIEQAIKDEVIPQLADCEGVTWGGRSLCSYKASKALPRTDWQALVYHQWPVPPAELVEQFTSLVPGPRVLRLGKALEESL